MTFVLVLVPPGERNPSEAKGGFHSEWCKPPWVYIWLPERKC